MRKHHSNLAIMTALCLLVALGCTSYNTESDAPDAPKVERGRLKLSKDLKALRIGNEYLYRDVTQYLFVDGKPWTPENDKDLANRIGWCDLSPNPNVEILRCSGDSSEEKPTSYILRMRDDKPEVQKIDEGGGSVWVNEDGRWLLFRKLFVNVETGQTIEVKGMPFTEERSGSPPVTYVIGISPDMKTVVALIDTIPKTEGAEEFLTLRIINTVTGRVDLRRASFTKYPWLKSWENPSTDIQPPPAPSKNFVWKKNAEGFDEIVVPALLPDKKAK